ncbi:MAG: hypothetical protein HQK72_03520 [Desulfamplus sp.]|nr:hypothetical protein [Desulfamplus sp.]
MEYPVLISPTLSLNVSELVEAWNSSDEWNRKAEAKQIHQDQAVGYPIDPETAQKGLLVFSGFAVGLALEIIKDLIKEFLISFLKKKFSKDPVVPEVVLKEMPPNSGVYLIIVKAKGE